MNRSPRVQLLVVSYRNNKELIGFFQHLDSHQSTGDVYVTAVANGLTSPEIETLRAATTGLLSGRITLVAGEQNPGYFGGASLALKATPANIAADWVIVTNDDIRFETDFFLRLLAVSSSTGLGVIAPDILVPATGLHQNPLYVEKPPGRRIRSLLWLHQHPLVMRLFTALREVRQLKRRRRSSVASGPKTSFPIYAPHGACIVFNRQYFTRGGTLDYPCFLYGEEFFVAETARRLQLSVQVEPALKVKHFEHSSTGLLMPTAMARHVRDSLSFILHNYYAD
jgi:GT2 family glycosyltransferase